MSAWLLIAALAVVLAFAGSLIFGLRGRNAEPVAEPGEAKPQSVVVQDARARVEVLNGSGKSGLAKLATGQLRDAGFDVVQFGNAQTTTASYVVDRVGKRDIAAAVGRQLSIAAVKTQIDTTRFVDVSVVLGKDWPPQKPRAAQKSWQDKLLRR